MLRPHKSILQNAERVVLLIWSIYG